MQVFVEAFSTVNSYVFVDIFLFGCVFFVGAPINMVLEWHKCEHENNNNESIKYEATIDALQPCIFLSYFHISTMRSQRGFLEMHLL